MKRIGPGGLPVVPGGNQAVPGQVVLGRNLMSGNASRRPFLVIPDHFPSGNLIRNRVVVDVIPGDEVIR